MSRPTIASFRVALVAGLVFLALAVYCLYQAYDARGKRPPLILRPLLPF